MGKCAISAGVAKGPTIWCDWRTAIDTDAGQSDAIRNREKCQAAGLEEAVSARTR